MIKLMFDKLLMDTYTYAFMLSILTLGGVETIVTILMMTITSVYGIVKGKNELQQYKLNRKKNRDYDNDRKNKD